MTTASATKQAAMKTFLELFGFHTTQFKNVLDGISDNDTMNRLNTKANHIAWLAGSLVFERFELARLIGVTGMQMTAHDLFSDHKGIQDGVQYPSLEEYRKDWDKISPALRSAIEGLTEEQLESADPFEMPGGPYTLYDTLVFCTDRESYVIGQIGLWRRLLGYEPMKFA
jgi:hypothetical protein